MKLQRMFILTLIGSLSFLTGFSQKADDVTGLWLNYDKDAQIEISKKGSKYVGKIVWIKEPFNPDGSPKLDTENPDEKLRGRKRIGLEILHNFTYNPDDKKWEGGIIYDPRSGSTYKAYMWFNGGNLSKLLLRGYVGFSLIGKTAIWTREDVKRVN